MTPQDPLRREPYAGWADDGQSRPLPPAQPQGWVDPPRSGLLDDGYLVEPEPPHLAPRREVTQELVERLRNTGASDDAVEFAQRRVLRHSDVDIDRAVRNGLTVGMLLGVALGVLAIFILALSGVPGVVAGEPAESEIGTAIYTASATWCAPTPDKCQGWGGNARLAAVNSFTWGDEPYPVRVWRGEMYVDVTVVSHCGCFGEDGYIDLSPAAFEMLAPLDRGRIDVEVEVLTDLLPHPDDQRMRLEDGGPIQLPATSTVDD